MCYSLNKDNMIYCWQIIYDIMFSKFKKKAQAKKTCCKTGKLGLILQILYSTKTVGSTRLTKVRSYL